MDFNDTPEEAAYRAAARAWLDSNVAEHNALAHPADMTAAKSGPAR